MSIKRLIAVAVMALALMGFASSAMAATDGVIRHVPNNTIIPENRELHFIGWISFIEDEGTAGDECHATLVIKITGNTGTTGHVSNLTVPDSTKCTGKGLFAGCTVTSTTATNLPYHVTATPTDFDVTPPAGQLIVIHTTNSGFLCPTSFTMTFSSMTLKPLKTKVVATTGTLGNIHESTAASGEPIAGVELEATGEAHIAGIGTVKVKARGEFELTSADRCTWKLVSS